MSPYGLSLSIDTTLEDVMPQEGSGTMRHMTSLMTSDEMVQGPVQKRCSFVEPPEAVGGVKSHTLDPA